MGNRKTLILIVLLFILSFVLIFYNFTNIPKYLAFDEIEFTKLALSLENKPYTAYSTLATGHSTMYFYILLLSLKTIGINVFALRLPSAIFAIFSIIFFYLIVNKIFKEKYKDNKQVIYKNCFPIILTFIFITSRWFINFARFSFEPTLLLFLELASIYFLLLSDVLKNKNTKEKNDREKDNKENNNKKLIINNLNLMLSGIFSGLAFNSYTPGRIFFLIPLFFLIKPLFSTNKEKVSNALKKTLFFIIPFLIVIAPLVIALNNIKDTRIDQLFFWRNHEMTIQQKVQGTAENIVSLTSMFFLKGDMNGRHNYPGKPALNPIMAIFFLIGLFYSLKKWKSNINILFLLYFSLSIIPSIPIYPWENPSMLRTFTVIPSTVYFIGIGIISITLLIKKLKISDSTIIIVITTLIFLSSFYELRTYFRYQSIVFEESFEIKYPLNKAIKMKNPYEKIK